MCHEGGGALSNVCDSLTGQCVCTERFTGHQCDECDVSIEKIVAVISSNCYRYILQIGFGNVTLGCPECECNSAGSTESFCDRDSGQCPCKMGVEGLRCDRCAEHYYNITEHGCEGEYA